LRLQYGLNIVGAALMHRRWKLAAVIGYALIPTLLLPRMSLADPGVWQEHRYSFVFLGFTSTYSCDGLADKLRVLLIAAGARKDSKALPGVCAVGFGRPDKLARAELTFYTLAPTPAGQSDGGQIDGTWRAVAFADRVPQELKTGDCELVEQFRTDLLPMFTTRNVDYHTTCIPNQDSGSVINLKFESFAPVPTGPHPHSP
jgi:hypothetical protein